MVNVLIVDDEHFIRICFDRALTEKGHTVVTAENGREALDKLVQEARPDIIFSDFNMPECNGGEFVTAIANDPTYEIYKTVPIIGIGDFPAGHPCLNYLKDRLHKPFVPDALQTMIEKYCQNL